MDNKTNASTWMQDTEKEETKKEHLKYIIEILDKIKDAIFQFE